MLDKPFFFFLNLNRVYVTLKQMTCQGGGDKFSPKVALTFVAAVGGFSLDLG